MLTGNKNYKGKNSTNIMTKNQPSLVEDKMKTYVFKVDMETDEEGWRAFYAPWEEMGASTWSKTKVESLKNIQEVLAMIVEEFIEMGKTIPEFHLFIFAPFQ